MKVWTLQTIHPYEKNAKKHPSAQIAQIAASIKEFGFNQPIVVDKNGVIIVGHGRYEAAHLLKLTKAPIISVDLDEKRAKAYRLADNKLNESDWDMELVIQELKALEDDALVALTGFEKDLLIEGDEMDDIIPENPEPLAKLGDLWQLGPHRVLCGDSTDKEAVARLMGGVQANMVFTDPPYNIAYAGSPDKRWEVIENDEMSPEGFDNLLTQAFARYKESIKTQAGLYIFHSPKTQDQFRKAIETNGFEIKSQLVWNKPSQVPGMGAYRSKHEPFYYACLDGEKAKFYGDRTHTSIWDFQGSDQELLNWAKREKRAEKEGKTTIWTMKREPTGDYKHPTQKPVELITYALFNSSKRGDLVLDLFLGSGSTLIAAEKTGRVCYGMELDPQYVDVIIERYGQYTGQVAKKIV